MAKNRQLYIEFGGNWKLVVYDYPLYLVILSGIIFSSLVIVTCIEPLFLLLDILFFPGALYLFLMTIIHRTVIEKNDRCLVIADKKVFGSDDNKILLSNIENIYLGEQTYSQNNVAKFGRIYGKTYFKKDVIAIKTTSRVLRLGHRFNEKTMVDVLDFLKEKLWK